MAGATAPTTPPATTTPPAASMAQRAPKRALAGAIMTAPRMVVTRYTLVAQLI